MIPGIDVFFKSYTEQPGDYWTCTVGIIACMFGLMAVVFQVLDMIRFASKTEASAVASEETYNTKRGKEQAYNNVYEYVIGKEKYRLKVKENRKVEAGQKVMVYYDRKHPSKSRTDRNDKMLILGIALMAIGVVMFLRGLTIAQG